MAHKIALVALGCAKNQVNSEQMLWLINDAGFEITGELQGADAVVVNTCGFIESAKREAIDTILELGELKRDGLVGKIVVAGCLAERYHNEIMSEMPEVDSVVGAGSFDDIVDVLVDTLGGNKVGRYGDINAPVSETERVISTGETWAYLKIAEGCDNRCAYCVIPSLRGRYRSRTAQSVVLEATRLVSSGIRELILVAQDITRFGLDRPGGETLSKLLGELARVDGLRWIRLHYLYPELIDDELIETISKEDKILKYLDIPIQHINDGILKAMNRRGTGGEIRELFKKLRERIPGIVLRTSIITGLPGEGKDEFEELCSFLREMKLERAGVFPFSPEEGTPAAEMGNRVDNETALKRAEIISTMQSQIMEGFESGRIGTTTTVLCEGFEDEAGLFYGRSYAESPEIDGRLYFSADEAKAGCFYSVLISSIKNGDPVGEMIGESL